MNGHQPSQASHQSSGGQPSGRRSIRRRSVLRPVVAVVLVTVALCSAACTAPFSTPPSISAAAVFTDVGSLVVGAPVEEGDLPVGRVTSITLDGSTADVGFIVNRSAAVPADLTVELRRTTILGQQYLELVDHGSGPSQPLLQDGAVITRTTVVPGLTQLLSSGAAVFGAVNDAQLSQLVATGAQGIGGQGGQIRSLLDNLGVVLKGYAGRTGEIRSLIGNIDQLTASLAPASGQAAAAVSTLATTTSVLASQSAQFEQLLASLNDLSVQGRALLETYVTQIDANLNGLAGTAATLQASERNLVGLIDTLPGNNAAITSLVRGNQVQVLADLVVCGLPLGGSNQSQPASTCGGRG